MGACNFVHPEVGTAIWVEPERRGAEEPWLKILHRNILLVF